MPLRYVSLAFFMAAQISLYDVSFDGLHRQVDDADGRRRHAERHAGHLALHFRAAPEPTAFAAPVVDGMMLMAAERPPFQSFFDGPSTVFCVAV